MRPTPELVIELMIIKKDSTKLTLFKDNNNDNKSTENKNKIQNKKIREVLSSRLKFSLDIITLGFANLYNSLYINFNTKITLDAFNPPVVELTAPPIRVKITKNIKKSKRKP